MIAIEIRNDEMRAVKLTNGLGSQRKVQKSSSVEIPFDALASLMTGNIMAMVDKVNELLLDLDVGDYSKYKFVVVMNLEGILTQRVQIPKVKDKELIYAISSALVRDNSVVTQDSIVTYSVSREKGKTEYDVISHVIDKSTAKSIIKIFEHLNLDVKYVDVSPNTIIKAFNSSVFLTSPKPLTLIADLSENEIRYYQFNDKKFNLSYLERADYTQSDYADSFENNIYQFLDEFNEYTLEDIDIILMGDEGLINKMISSFEGIFYMRRFFEGFSTFDTRRIENINKYVNLLGSLIRYDTLLSSHAKFDVNLLRQLNEASTVKDKKAAFRNVAIMGTLASVLAIGYIATLLIANNNLADENERIRAYVESPVVNEQIAMKEKVNEELGVYDNALSSLTTIEDYLVINKKPYNSRVYYSVTQNVPRNSGVTNLVYREGTVEISYETADENTFKEYLVMLAENELIESVDYTGYSSSGLGYAGKITVKLKGRVK